MSEQLNNPNLQNDNQDSFEQENANIDAVNADVDNTDLDNESEENSIDNEENYEEGQDHHFVKKNNFQKRINQLTREKYELKGKLEAFEKMQQQQQYQEQEVQNLPLLDVKKPSRYDFRNDEDFFEALTDYKLAQKEAQKELQQREHAQKSIVDNFIEKEKKAVKEYPDYFEVVENAQGVMIHQALVEPIQTSELGADLRYYLAKNPQEAQKTLNMSASDAIKYLGKLEAKIEARKQKKQPISNAPSPIRPPKAASGGNVRFNINDDKIDMNTWMKERNKQLKK